MKTPDQLRKHNTLKVLRYLYEVKNSTKSEIASETGLTMVTISSIINQLFDKKLLIKNGVDSQNIGRNSIIYGFNCNKNHIIGINMGIDYISFREEDLEGNIIGRKIMQVDSDITYDKVITILYTYISAKKQAIGVGITIPGVSNPTTKKIEFIPNLNSIKNKYLESDLEKKCQLPIIVEKDVYAGTLLYKENDSNQSLALVSIKGGIGCGMLTDGKILKGHNQMAGEIGHISINPAGPLCSCGQKGCVEQYISDYALCEKLEMGMNNIIDSSNKGDLKCLVVLKEACLSLFILMGYIQKFYSPEDVIINSQWLNEIPSIKSYFLNLYMDNGENITIIYDKHNYEKGAVHVFREQLLTNIEKNILLGE
ncbi:MAG: ROK family protein [Clostridiales bacterium]|nr:ROK family protein [Clostridiales bacterium]